MLSITFIVIQVKAATHFCESPKIGVLAASIIVNVRS